MIPVSRLFSVQDQSNSLSNYTLKGIEFLEKVGCFVKERAAIEEEYSAKLRNLARKYAKKADDDEILKSVTFSQSFNGVLHQLELVANYHLEMSDRLKNDIQSFTNSKSVQHRSSRKHTIGDLSTIDENLNSTINDVFCSRKNYFRAFKDAEHAFVKFTKADKNLEISRLDLERTRNHLNSRNAICDEAKICYQKSVEAANECQANYYEKMLPMIFEKFKTLDQDCISDIKEIFKRCNDIEKALYLNIGECRRNVQTCISHINPEHDASIVLDSVESTIIRPPRFVIDDLGDPNDIENRSADFNDGRRVDQVLNYIQKRRQIGEDSPGKKKSIRQLFGMKEKTENKANSDEEDYADLPPKVRLRCLKSKIGKLEKRLEKAMQAREGLNKLQNAYRENPKHGNASDCNEQLYQHAKEIEFLSIRIETLKNLAGDVEAAIIESGDVTHRSFGGRDTTPDTTRSISGCSTNHSSKASTLEDPLASLMEPGFSRFSIGGSSTNGEELWRPKSSNNVSACSSPARASAPVSRQTTPLSRRGLVSPLRMREISSPILRNCSSSPQQTTIALQTRIDSELGCAVALFGFEGTTYETISLKERERVLLLERDNGDGWIRVRRACKQEEGFVPTSYLKCTWYS